MKSTQFIFATILILILILLFASCIGQESKYKKKSKAERDSEKLARSLGIELDEWKVEEDYYRANSYKELVKLSKEKSDITHLKFYRSNRKLDTLPLPSEIGNFKNLTHLVLYSFNTNAIPKSIVKLQNLKSLTIRIPSLVHIPEYIGELKSLEELIISFADDTQTISSKIFQLPNLKKLELSRIHQPTVILEDNSFDQLTNLQELIIHDTSMKIPKSINKLKNLKILDLGLYYGDVPPEAYELKGVETLKLYSISKDEMIGIGNLKKVKTFELMDGNTISSEISEMKDLIDFTIWKTYTDEFPEELSELNNLRKLKIVGTSKLKEVPNFIYKLKSLEELSLVGCDSLKTLDNKILRISTIKTINLERNKSLVLTDKQKSNNKIKIKN